MKFKRYNAEKTEYTENAEERRYELEVTGVLFCAA
jgi:hypothetical protein